MATHTVVNDAVFKNAAILTMPENASIRLYVKKAGLVSLRPSSTWSLART